MWPENEKVTGEFGFNRNNCEQLSKNIYKVINSSVDDGSGNKLNDKFWYFTIYYSPAFDAKRYQEHLSANDYTQWVRSYLQGGYGPDSLSPFSSNYSIVAKEEIDDESRAVDPSSVFELEVFNRLTDTIQYEKEVPILVGPDRSSVQATVETLESYEMADEFDLRPDYRMFVQAIGTQARYADNTAIESNFKVLAEDANM